MTTRSADDPSPTREIDARTMHRLLLHEARVHAIPGRTLRDLGDAILLHDPADSELFWNRLEGLRWPVEAGAFDRRLTEMLVLFASLGRRPHVWASPLHDAPADLAARFIANGFRDMGAGGVMILVDPAPAQAVAGDVDERRGDRRASGRPGGRGRRARRPCHRRGPARRLRGRAERQAGIEAETAASLRHPWFTHYLVRQDGGPAAVARRATFDGAELPVVDRDGRLGARSRARQGW